MLRLASAILIALTFFIVAPPASAQDASKVPLQGNWRFEKDAADAANLSFGAGGNEIQPL